MKGRQERGTERTGGLEGGRGGRREGRRKGRREDGMEGGREDSQSHHRVLNNLNNKSLFFETGAGE